VNTRFLVLYGAIVLAAVVETSMATAPKPMKQPLVRIAELEIDPGQLQAYRDALKEEIATSIRVELGVLTLYAVSLKDQPSQVRIFETYKDQAAYESHVRTSHFKKYKTVTLSMVKSLRLIVDRADSVRRKVTSILISSDAFMLLGRQSQNRLSQIRRQPQFVVKEGDLSWVNQVATPIENMFMPCLVGATL
jgi:quinol monooxygenase YgiN